MKKFDVKDLKTDIIHDFDKFIEYLFIQTPKLTDSKEILPIKSVIDTNKLLKAPQVLSSRPQQEHCPKINFLYHLTVHSKLFVKEKKGKKTVLKKTEYLDIYSSFTDIEKYFYLLQSWWCNFNWSVLYNFREYEDFQSTLEIVLNTIKKNGNDKWINSNNIENSFMIKRLHRELVMTFEYLGLWNIKFNTEHKERYHYFDSIMFNNLGNEIIERLFLKRDFDTWNDYRIRINKKKEKFINAFKPLFDKGQLENTISKEIKVVQGNYTFKISLNKTYAIFKVSSKINLDELHDIIQEIIGFDNDHLYCFYMDGRKNPLRTYVSPEDIGKNYADNIIIEELELYIGKSFEYLFDYGDFWRFKITVENIEQEDEIEKPILLETKGEFPEQYHFEEDYF